jgi:hypothetical protein
MTARYSQVSAPDLPQELTKGGRFREPFPMNRTFSKRCITVQDESLKNLMMSWYWAGYYTGLNEGLNRAKQNTGKQAEKGENTG